MEGGSALTGLTTLFTQFTTWMGKIMLLPLGVFVVGAAIGLAGRLIGR